METRFDKKSPTLCSKHLKRKILRQNYITLTCMSLDSDKKFFTRFFKVCLAICHDDASKFQLEL